MDRLYLLSWYYQGAEGESEARDFFGKLREGVARGKKFPFNCPYQVGLVHCSIDVHWCVGVLVMRGTSGDDSVEQTDKLLRWFEECDADYAGADRTGIRAAGASVEYTLVARYGSHYRCVEVFDVESVKVVSSIQDTQDVPNEIQRFIETIKSGDDDEREDAIKALANIGPAAVTAVPVIIAAVKEDALCWTATEALGAIGGKDAMQALCQILATDSDMSVRMRAAHSLGKIGDSGAILALTKALRHPHEMVRTAVVNALAILGDQTVTPAIEPLLTDSSEYVRDAAVKALERIKARQAEKVPSTELELSPANPVMPPVQNMEETPTQDDKVQVSWLDSLTPEYRTMATDVINLGANDPDARYKAYQVLDQKRYRDEALLAALPRMEAAIPADDLNTRVQLYCGLGFWLGGNIYTRIEGENLIKRAIELIPLQALPHTLLGSLLMGDSSNTFIEQGQTSFRLHPELSDQELELLARDYHEKARIQLDEAIRLNPDDPTPYYAYCKSQFLNFVELQSRYLQGVQSDKTHSPEFGGDHWNFAIKAAKFEQSASSTSAFLRAMIVLPQDYYDGPGSVRPQSGLALSCWQTAKQQMAFYQSDTEKTAALWQVGQPTASGSPKTLQPLPATNQEPSTIKPTLAGVSQQYLSQGYRVISQTEDTIRLERRASPDTALLILSFLLLTPSALIYFLQARRKIYRVQLHLDSDGQVSESGDKVDEFQRDKNRLKKLGWKVVGIDVLIYVVLCLVLVGGLLLMGNNGSGQLFAPKLTPTKTSPLLTSGQITALPLEALLIQAGDFPSAYKIGDASNVIPERYKDNPVAQKQISVGLTRNDSWQGDVSIFLYEKQTDIDKSYGQESAHSEDISGLGEKSNLIVFSVPYSGGVLDGLNLVFIRCSAVVHMRILVEGITKDDIIAYAKRLDKRLAPSVCNNPVVVVSDEIPKPGKWVATADFGVFEFYVNDNGTGIPKIDFGGVLVTTDDSTGYPINNNKFGMMLDFIRIDGEFDKSGVFAKGTWKYLKKSGAGTWSAVPSAAIATNPTAAIKFTPTIKPSPTKAKGVPAIQFVYLRKDKSSGSLIIYQDVYFVDNEGDVTSWDFEVVSSTIPDVRAEGGTLDIPSAEQKTGAVATGEWGCGDARYTVTLRVTLFDRAGNHSEPYTYTMDCDG